jgi:N-acyl-D-amino-acid deacylase
MEQARLLVGILGVAVAGAVVLCASPPCAGADAGAEAIPVTTMHPDEALKPFDDEMLAYMRARHIPGGALAVSRGGKLVLSRGYGWADKEARVQVAPDALFRIASISKPITSAAVM